MQGATRAGTELLRDISMQLSASTSNWLPPPPPNEITLTFGKILFYWLHILILTGLHK